MSVTIHGKTYTFPEGALRELCEMQMGDYDQLSKEVRDHIKKHGVYFK